MVKIRRPVAVNLAGGDCRPPQTALEDPPLAKVRGNPLNESLVYLQAQLREENQTKKDCWLLKSRFYSYIVALNSGSAWASGCGIRKIVVNQMIGALCEATN